MSYAGKIEDLIAERDELRATLTAVSDSLDYLHGMTPQQAAEVRKTAERYRWMAPRMLAADFDYMGSGTQVLVFEMPDGFQASADCDSTIDAAMAAAPAVG